MRPRNLSQLLSDEQRLRAGPRMRLTRNKKRSRYTTHQLTPCVLALSSKLYSSLHALHGPTDALAEVNSVQFCRPETSSKRG